MRNFFLLVDQSIGILFIESVRLSVNISILKNKQSLERHMIYYSISFFSFHLESELFTKTPLHSITFFRKGRKNPSADIFISFFLCSKQEMDMVVLCLLLFQLVIRISSSMISAPVIRNVSLQIPGYNSTKINGTCRECLCAMLLNETSISSFNCIHTNQTCELFSQSLNTTAFSLVSDTASSVYFKSIPNTIPASTVSPTDQDTSRFLSESCLFFWPLRLVHLNGNILEQTFKRNPISSSHVSIHIVMTIIQKEK